MSLSFEDTPIERVSILEMPANQLQEFVASLQERRLRTLKIYQLAQDAKKNKEADKQSAELDKRLTQFISKHETVLKGLSALEKYAIDIIGLRLALGHSPEDVIPQKTQN